LVTGEIVVPAGRMLEARTLGDTGLRGGQGVFFLRLQVGDEMRSVRLLLTT
jgi:hypothetical protein